MKRAMAIALSLLLCLGVPMMVCAEEVTTCTVTADSIPTPPGELITVPVRIAENEGFTNFAISLEYDPEMLQLVSVNTAESEAAYLCGTQTAVKTEQDKGTCFIVSASADAVSEDGILFTVTFRISEALKEYTVVTPVVHYIRNNEAVFSVFEEITASVAAGTITVIVSGDLNGDGVVEYDDVMLACKASLGEVVLTEEQQLLADLNNDKKIDSADAEAIYRIYTGG